MFCSSESCDSAIWLLKPRSGPVDMEALYSLYSPFPLFTLVRGRRCSPKFVLSKSSRLLERSNLEREGVPNTRCQHREGAGDKEVDQPVARVCLRGGPPGSHRAEPTVDREVDRDCQREEQRCRL